MGPLSISPLPSGKMLSIVIRGHCRDTGEGKGLPPSSSLSHSAGSWSSRCFQDQALAENGFASTHLLQCAADKQHPAAFPDHSTSLSITAASSEAPHIPVNSFLPQDEYPQVPPGRDLSISSAVQLAMATPSPLRSGS